MNGPNGLQQRLNGELFDWEPTPTPQPSDDAAGPAGPESPATTAAPPAADAPASQPRIAPEAGWNIITRLEGQGNRFTDDFTITTNRWRIRWITSAEVDEDSYFQILVYRTDNQRIPVDAMGEVGRGTVSQSGNGLFYLAISTNVPYTVVVEAP